jgi:hypothetical protein
MMVLLWLVRWFAASVATKQRVREYRGTKQPARDYRSISRLRGHHAHKRGQLAQHILIYPQKCPVPFSHSRSITAGTRGLQ